MPIHSRVSVFIEAHPLKFFFLSLGSLVIIYGGLFIPSPINPRSLGSYRGGWAKLGVNHTRLLGWRVAQVRRKSGSALLYKGGSQKRLSWAYMRMYSHSSLSMCKSWDLGWKGFWDLGLLSPGPACSPMLVWSIFLRWGQRGGSLPHYMALLGPTLSQLGQGKGVALLGDLVSQVPGLVIYCTMVNRALSKRLRKILRNKYRYESRVLYILPPRRFFYLMRHLKAFHSLSPGITQASRFGFFFRNLFLALGDQDRVDLINEVRGQSPGPGATGDLGWHFLRSRALGQKAALGSLVVQNSLHLFGS